MLKRIFLLSLFFGVLGCDGSPANSPYSKAERTSNRYFTSFDERPKTLDPAKAYSANEYEFIAQILEPPLQYHYLKRPYTLVPLGLSEMPTVSYLDASGKLLGPWQQAQAAFSEYHLKIKPGRLYGPHPGFARNAAGAFRYHQLPDDIDVNRLADFHHQDTRVVTAQDYAYQIKRLADPKNVSPILSVMEQYIVGLTELSDKLTEVREKQREYLDLREFDLSGVKVINDSELTIRIKGLYPQFMYWLSMPFFAPIPWEVDRFYAQPILKENNISFDWYPVGSGPYYLAVNNPNRMMKLVKNPHFGGERYPTEGETGDEKEGLLERAGQPLPFIDEVWFYLEKESIPRWAKFLQGYYDRSGIGSDSFDQAIQLQSDGSSVLTQSMLDKGIQLSTSIAPSLYYFGFNMLNDRVGGYSEKQAKFRQAVSIAVDFEEFISIFMNGRGEPAQGPIPPGIFGYQDQIDPYVYEQIKGRQVRKPIEAAQRLLAASGYPGGIDPKTKRPLVLHLDITGSNGPDDKARFDWFRKEFKKLGLDLHIRATQYNRFQDKLRNGTAEMFFMGWNADYPDPENFLFLLYGPNGKVKHQGENATNYQHTLFDSYFKQMRTMTNGPQRQAIIDKMVKLVQHDAPWMFGFYPKQFVLSHQWFAPSKPNAMANNTLKYQYFDPNLRVDLQAKWNKVVLWPLIVLWVLALLVLVPILNAIRSKEESI